jgi:hypothetical protein
VTYRFEYPVKFRDPSAMATTGRIDLYKKSCFVLEAKQSRLKGASQGNPAGAGQPCLGRAQRSARGAAVPIAAGTY